MFKAIKMNSIFVSCLLVLCCLFTVCFLSPVFGQEEYEDLLESEDEVSDQSEFTERIAELRKHPLDLNSVSVDELLRIPWLSPVQAQEIVRHREKFGRFQSVSDLRALAGLNEELCNTMTPFVRVKARRLFPPLSARFQARVIRGGLSQESKEDEFLFNEKVYTRSEVNISDRVTIGILTEKDAHEKNFNDHIVYSLSIDQWHMFERILLGNYRLDFGQGLVLGDYSGSFKGASFPLTLRKRGRGLRAYTSTSEAGPFFGFACMGSVDCVNVSLFHSKAQVDATLNSDSTVSSVYESGLHRTETEQRKKDTLQERMVGAHISCEQGNWGSVGVSIYHSGYDHIFDAKDVERKQYTFRGQTNTVAGVNFDLYCRRLNVFGEAARASSSGAGMLVGALIDFDQIEIDALVRDYGRDFYNLHNYAFAERPDETQNESGTLVGFVYRPNSRTRLRAYVDRLRNPWRRYYEKMPPSREEFWSQIEHKVSKRVQSTLRFRVRTRDMYKKIMDDESKNVKRQHINTRGQVDWQFSKKGRFRGRCEHVRVRYPDLSIEETGWLLLGELRLVPGQWLTLDNKLVFFKTDSYDSRIYEYENDLPGVMTNLGLYGRGVRWYILAKSTLGSHIRFSLKFSITHFNDGDKEDDRRVGVQCELNPVL